MYHTEPPTDKTIREWYMNSNRVAACVLRNEQAVRAYGTGRPVRFAVNKCQQSRSYLNHLVLLFLKIYGPKLV